MTPTAITMTTTSMTAATHLERLCPLASLAVHVDERGRTMTTMTTMAKTEITKVTMTMTAANLTLSASAH
jgi:hypothetical protein